MRCRRRSPATCCNRAIGSRRGLDGVAYLEKSPLKYWLIAISFRVFGAHDWAARIPIALATVLLCWVTSRFAAWAFGERAGLYSGLALSTCIGLFLFTRILIPDSMLTLAVTLALWSLMRSLDPEEKHPGAVGARDVGPPSPRGCC